MNSQPASSPSVADLAREENATPEQIVASALVLYAALPPAVRASMLDALGTGAQGSLASELVRTAVVHEFRQRRKARRDRVAAGELEALPDLTDEEMGAEAVRLVKDSRRRRATSRE
jgi:hypothetical protein